MVVHMNKLIGIVTVLLVATLASAQNPIPIVDVWATAGSCRATVAHDSVLHAGAGGYLISTDVADPAGTELLATTWFGEQVQDVALIENDEQVLVAVALGHRGLSLVDVTDPSHPERLGDLADCEAWQLVWIAPRLYVAAALGGVAVVDVSDPDQPQVTGDIPVRPAHSPRALAGGIGRLFVAALDDSLEVYTLAEPDHPTRLGGARGGNYVGLDCNGPLLAALTSDGLQLIDSSNFNGLPVLAEWSSDLENSMPLSVLLDGDRAWVADYREGLYLIDISDPSLPETMDLAPLPDGQSWSVGKVNGLLALGTVAAGVFLMDVEESTIVEQGRVTDPHPASLSMIAAGQGRLVATGPHQSFVSMPSPPYDQPAGQMTVVDMAVEVCGFDGDRAVLGCWQDDYPSARMVVIDTADPANPVLLHSGHGLPTGMNDHSQKAVVEGNYAYIENSGLRVSDLTDIDPVFGPEHVGGYGMLQNLGDFELVGPDRLCIWRGDQDALLMLDRTNLWSMTVIETLPVAVSPLAMYAHDDLFFVAAGPNILIFDISDPTSSHLVGEIALGSFAKDLVATEDGLWIALGGAGLQVWNLGDVTAPRLAASITDQGRIDALAVSGDHVVASAPFRGLLWLGRLTTATPDLAPVAASLAQNQPNPFNPSTSISYTMPRDGMVRLTVHDLRGRLVRTLVDGSRAEGRQSAVWNGRNEAGAAVASGVYVYRLQAGGQTLSRSMSLIK